MSPKYSLIAVALSAMLLAVLACSARAQTDKATMMAVELECDAFRKNPDGSWAQTRKTEVKYGIASMDLNETTFRRNAINVFGVDLATLLEQRCTAPSQKK